MTPPDPTTAPFAATPGAGATAPDHAGAKAVDLGLVRDDYVHYVHRQLVGPFDGAAEVIVDPPSTRYLMGILFPRKIVAEEYFEAQGEELDETEGVSDQGRASMGQRENQFADTSVESANDFLPSSVGISFFTDAPTISVTAEAAAYETIHATEAAAAAAAPVAPAAVDSEGSDATDTPDAADSSVSEAADVPRGRRRSRAWRRLGLPAAAETFEATTNRQIWDGRAEIRVRWRTLAQGSLVTVTLVNAVEANPDQVGSSYEDMLFQTGLSVTTPTGTRIKEYPTPALASTDPEEAELRLMYRHRRMYAVGHGCSAGWDAPGGTDPDSVDREDRVAGTGGFGGDDVVDRVWTEAMPTAVVPRIAAPVSNAQVLLLANLAPGGWSDDQVVAGLERFVAAYRMWIDGQRTIASRLGASQADVTGRILGRLEIAADRMADGVAALASGTNALTAFRVANEAMLRQMRHSRDDLAGKRRDYRDPLELPHGYATSDAAWRPFQLGFVLTAVAGLIDPNRDDRDIVDLIWFPTGGGKTEAYLLLSSFEIVHRRLVHGPAGGGTAVLSRYTLSLLTTQQFQRTATTICALECLRRERGDLGAEPISIGLWVGDGTTPNRFTGPTGAESVFDDVREARHPHDAFLLERCPWCGTEILPRAWSEDDAAYGVTATSTSFAFNCPQPVCTFHEHLPVHVVDDDLYDHPPTFLLGTVDKFAGLAWEPRSGVFFGGNDRRKPSMIIQDELHLLTGPLGTVAAVYETAINLLCEQDGRPPKVVASTATIRRAGAQVRGLFGRDVELFPPAGLNADQSYFAEIDERAPGRLYVGLMAQGHTSDTATVQTCTALLQAPVDLELDGDAKDAYWTLVAYHNSLRELGRTVTMALDDIPARIKTLMAGRPLREYDIEELTSNVPRSEQPRLLDRLGKRADDPDHIGMVASTNMLSVGVDVPRLGLMLMNGQPKANAEYIQATSRVGRSTTPGLIFTMFRPTRPRDRSHYENFQPFHRALYRHVEPTSVTPYAPPSRDRSLHAALTILVRHRLGLAADDQAGAVLHHTDEVDSLVEAILAVVERVEPRELDSTRKQLEGFVAGWRESAETAQRAGRSFYYKPNGKQHTNLMKDFNQKGVGRPTLRSMRNVDRETLVALPLPGQASTGGRS